MSTIDSRGHPPPIPNTPWILPSLCRRSAMAAAPWVCRPMASASDELFLTSSIVVPAAVATSSRVIAGFTVGSPNTPPSINNAFAPKASICSLQNATSVPFVSSAAITRIVFMDITFLIFAFPPVTTRDGDGMSVNNKPSQGKSSA